MSESSLSSTRGFSPSLAAAALAILAMAGATASRNASAADDPLGADEIVARVNERLAGRSVSRKIGMTLTSRSGKAIQRKVGSFRKYDGDDMRSVIYFLSPQSVRGSSFLVYDYVDPSQADDQWIYLPAVRRARRIASSDRGDYFMGTDFTNNDVKQETDLSATDYHWRLDGTDTIDTSECLILEGKPVDTETAKDLGYSRVRMCVAKQHWIPLRGEYWDLRNNPLKTIHISDIRQVDNIWTPHRIEAERKDDGHRTALEISDVDYETDLNDLLFSKRSLDSIPGRFR
jgi:outer membrane lipoprotein-sorting protein